VTSLADWRRRRSLGIHDLIYLLTGVVATEQGTYIPYATLLKSWAVSRMVLVRPTSKWLRRCESVGVPNYLSCVIKTQYMPTFKGRKLMGVTAARVKTEKSKRRPGKSTHVAVDVKWTGTVHAATIRSKEVASCYFRPKCMSSTPAVQFAPLPLPAFPGFSDPMRGGERSRLDSQILGKPEPTGPSRRRRRYVWVQCRPVFVRLCECETKLKPRIALREEKMLVNR